MSRRKLVWVHQELVLYENVQTLDDVEPILWQKIFEMPHAGGHDWVAINASLLAFLLLASANRRSNNQVLAASISLHPVP